MVSVGKTIHYATPPLAPIFCPVIHLASSVAKNTTIFAMSEGKPKRLNALLLASWVMTSSDLPSINRSVAVGPGKTQLTFIPLFPTSLANTLLNCGTAALVAENHLLSNHLKK
ncbi:hypothetical protein SAMN05444380_10324 [Thermophagus xiamenensis]|uniref:Uncharacterized protein n=1 Tax=Thermophagus xiamenensis TaxID=385682 RepID=A0A1I1VR52_9BACT|nr:hypothetical protein SAMN05444380_10324 [Thermophagus xiamenensis]